MAVHKVLTIWERPELLFSRAKEMDPTDAKMVQRVAQDLIDTFWAELTAGKGIAGLAANEIGYDARAILLLSDVYDRINCEKFVIINPTIVYRSGKNREFWCGCGSVPGYVAHVLTDRDISIGGHTPSGELFFRGFTDTEASVALHEVDHINGKTIWGTKYLMTEEEFQLEQVRKARRIRRYSLGSM